MKSWKLTTRIYLVVGMGLVGTLGAAAQQVSNSAAPTAGSIPASVAANTSTPAASPAAVESPKVHWGVDANITSQYIWRGFQANSTPSLQPNLWINYRGVTISSWSNLARRGPNGQQWTEHDLTIDYTRPIKRGYSFSAGYINYVFPDLASGRWANEFYGGLRYDGKVSVSFKAFQNVGLSRGTYFQATLAKTFNLTESVLLNTSLASGYNRRMFIPGSTFSDLVSTVSISFPMGPRVRIAPNVNYSQSLDRTYFRNHWFGGLTISFSK